MPPIADRIRTAKKRRLESQDTAETAEWVEKQRLRPKRVPPPKTAAAPPPDPVDTPPVSHVMHRAEDFAHGETAILTLQDAPVLVRQGTKMVPDESTDVFLESAEKQFSAPGTRQEDPFGDHVLGSGALRFQKEPDSFVLGAPIGAAQEEQVDYVPQGARLVDAMPIEAAPVSDMAPVVFKKRKQKDKKSKKAKKGKRKRPRSPVLVNDDDGDFEDLRGRDAQRDHNPLAPDPRLFEKRQGYARALEKESLESARALDPDRLERSSTQRALHLAALTSKPTLPVYDVVQHVDDHPETRAGQGGILWTEFMGSAVQSDQVVQEAVQAQRGQEEEEEEEERPEEEMEENGEMALPVTLAAKAPQSVAAMLQMVAGGETNPHQVFTGRASDARFAEQVDQQDQLVGVLIAPKKKKPRMEQQEIKPEDSFRFQVHLDYVDDLGRQQTPKEAFRHLSYKFHGIKPGKKAQSKRVRQLEEQEKERKARLADTPLGFASSLRGRMEKTQNPFVVLSKEKRG